MIKAEKFEVSKLNSFLIGFGVGAIVALIFAPKSGKELRGNISNTAHRGADFANNSMKKVKDGVTHLYTASYDKTVDVINASKHLLDIQKDIVTKAVDAGKKAYLDNKAPSNNNISDNNAISPKISVSPEA